MVMRSIALTFVVLASALLNGCGVTSDQMRRLNVDENTYASKCFQRISIKNQHDYSIAITYSQKTLNRIIERKYKFIKIDDVLSKELNKNLLIHLKEFYRYIQRNKMFGEVYFINRDDVAFDIKNYDFVISATHVLLQSTVPFDLVVTHNNTGATLRISRSPRWEKFIKAAGVVRLNRTDT